MVADAPPVGQSQQQDQPRSTPAAHPPRRPLSMPTQRRGGGDFGAVEPIGYCSARTSRRVTGGDAQADVAQLVERNLAKVEVASSSLVVRSERSPPYVGLHGGLAERRGNGLQIRLHGFKSRTHLAPSQLNTGDWRSGSALP